MSSSNINKVTPDYLAKLNSHPRDQFITFDEGPHIYTVNGELGYTSVTTWNHSHFSHFDAEAIVNNILRGRKMRDPTYKYYGMTKEQILESWDINRDQASGSGTNMHYDIECYFNQMPVQNDSVEYQWFLRFANDFPDLKPYRTEWMIYYEELKLSGSIDMIFENPDGTIQIYDWKRCKEIAYESDYGKFALTPCISHLPDTNFWHYSLQLNTYKTILEEKYGKKVTGLYLVCLHPNNQYKTYDRIEVPFLEKEMKDLFDYRRAQLESAA
jgi:ATP-dependent exoDNAse (exonuclease V) beta subunit